MTYVALEVVVAVTLPVLIQVLLGMVERAALVALVFSSLMDLDDVSLQPFQRVIEDRTNTRSPPLSTLDPRICSSRPSRIFRQ